MKKIALILITLITVVSCRDDVQFNNPGFEGLRNGNFLWKASSYDVVIDANGYLTFSGSNGDSSLSLTIPSAAIGTYTLGDVNSMRATYNDGIAYATIQDGNANPVSVSDGQIVIEDINFINKTFTGKFNFNAYDVSGINVVNFSQGIFFKLPLTSGDFPAVIITCVDTQDDTDEALAAYLATFTDVDIIDKEALAATCEVYKSALETQRLYCGDTSDALQTIINNLGNCELSCEQAVANRNFVQTQFEASTIGTHIALCNNYKLFLEEQIEICGDVGGTVQTTIDDLDCVDDDGDGVPNVYEDTNDDGDYDNDDTDNDGTPDYLDTDDDGDGILTSAETLFDADGNPADTDGDAAANYLDVDDDGDGVLTINETGDTDGDGIIDSLDADDDGDTILTIFENPDVNSDGDPADAIDTDLDGTPNYLDTDDDEDGNLTADENPDPNGDGNPSDALDSDMDTIPDYLDNI